VTTASNVWRGLCLRLRPAGTRHARGEEVVHRDRHVREGDQREALATTKDRALEVAAARGAGGGVVLHAVFAEVDEHILRHAVPGVDRTLREPVLGQRGVGDLEEGGPRGVGGGVPVGVQRDDRDVRLRRRPPPGVVVELRADDGTVA
jgi:hypothetical protein